MKNVLIITTHFAPDGHVGAKRMTKFAKFLPMFGWQPIVLTMENKDYYVLDHTLTEDLPKTLNIVRVKKWTRRKNVEYSVHCGIQRSTLFRSLVSKIVFYDYRWLVPAIIYGRKILKQGEVSLIFSSSPNPEAHLAGMVLKKIMGVPWVADFRDPWAILNKHLNANPFRMKIEQFLERAVILHANHIVTTSGKLASDYGTINKERKGQNISVIYNGFDKDDFCESVHSDTDARFTINYIGTLGAGRNPEFFLRAIGKLLRMYPETGSEIKVNLIGGTKYDLQMGTLIASIISEEGLASVVNVVPYIAHRDALAQLKSGHVALLIVSDLHSELGCLSSKIFQYLYAGKPILALAPLHSEEAAIINNLGAGCIVNGSDVTAICEKVYDMYNCYKNGTACYFANEHSIEKYDRKNQTEQLARIFHMVAKL